MDEIEANAKALVDAIEADNDDQAKAAIQGLIIGAGRLFERAVVALETMAQAVDTYDRPTTVRTRNFS